MRSQNASHDNVRAWDLPTRLFHWTLVTLIACAWISFQYSEKLGDFNLRCLQMRIGNQLGQSMKGLPCKG